MQRPVLARSAAAVVTVVMLVTGATTPVADAASPISGSLTALSPTTSPQGRIFRFSTTLTNTSPISKRAVATLELIGPDQSLTPFLVFSTTLGPGQSKTTKQWVVSARYFAALGSFTIRLIVAGSTVDELTYTVTPTDVALPSFTDVTAAAGVDVANGLGAWGSCESSSGAAWADVDDDGDLDLFVPSLGPATVPHHLWINDGSGHFEDEAAARGIVDLVPGMGAVFADYDNDGDADLYRSNNGPNQLYRNDGTGSFTDVAEVAGVADSAMSTSAAWGDYDRDGLLDLYSTNYGDCVPRFPGSFQPDHLYRQRPDHTFEDTTAQLPATRIEGTGFQTGFFDFDDDGDLDIYVANDHLLIEDPPPDTNRLFRNDGADGGTWRWTDVTRTSRTAYGINSMGLGLGDPDRDLDLDMVISNIGPDVHARNNGDGTFSSVASQTYIAAPPGSLAAFGDVEAKNPVTWAEVFLDIDNDGWEDLYTAQSTVGRYETDHRPNRLFMNGRDGTFLDLSEPSGAAELGASRGVAVADYNVDGLLDLLSVNKVGPPVLFLNTTVGPGNWIEIDTVGTRSNRDGCGARAILTSASGVQRRDVFCGSTSLGSGVDSTLHFGLGGDTAITSLVVTWPSGVVQSMSLPDVNQRIVITEPAP